MKTINCPHCGAKNPDYWTDCHICKKALKTDEAAEPETPTNTTHPSPQSLQQPAIAASAKRTNSPSIITLIIIGIIMIWGTFSLVNYFLGGENSDLPSGSDTVEQNASFPSSSSPTISELKAAIESKTLKEWQNGLPTYDWSVTSDLKQITKTGYDYEATTYIQSSKSVFTFCGVHLHIVGGDEYDWILSYEHVTRNK